MGGKDVKVCMKTARLIESRGAATLLKRFLATFFNGGWKQIGKAKPAGRELLASCTPLFLILHIRLTCSTYGHCKLLKYSFQRSPAYNSLLQMPNYLNKIVLHFLPHHQNYMGLMHLQSVKDMES